MGSVVKHWPGWGSIKPPTCKQEDSFSKHTNKVDTTVLSRGGGDNLMVFPQFFSLQSNNTLFILKIFENRNIWYGSLLIYKQNMFLKGSFNVKIM